MRLPKNKATSRIAGHAGRTPDQQISGANVIHPAINYLRAPPPWHGLCDLRGTRIRAGPIANHRKRTGQYEIPRTGVKTEDIAMFAPNQAVARRPRLHRWLAATAGLMLGVLAAHPAKAQDTIKIGILHSLSGTMAISETTLKD